MGCCYSAATDNSLEIKYKKVLPKRHSVPLRGPIKHIGMVSKHIKRFKLTDVRWQKIVAEGSSDSNIFMGVLTKYPEVRLMFEVDKNDPLCCPIGIQRHTALMHKVIESCIAFIIHGECQDVSLTLHALGAYHAQLGVTIHHMMTFQSTSIAFVHDRMMKDKKHTKELQHEVDVIMDVLHLIVEIMLVGMNRHNNVVTYVKMILNENDNCWTNSQARKGCHTRTAAKSWKKMHLYLSRM